MTLPPGQAKLVKAGSDFVFQMHYTANGKAGTDRSRIGVIFAKEPPKERVFTANATNSKFVIPAGDPAYRVDVQHYAASACAAGRPDAAHALSRQGFRVPRWSIPTGETQIVLSVPKYDFNWQLFYYFVRADRAAQGTKIECTAHFDNSPNNRYNPDPNKEVRWGDQTLGRDDDRLVRRCGGCRQRPGRRSSREERSEAGRIVGARPRRFTGAVRAAVRLR